MTKLRVHTFFISLDGYGAGPNQDRDNPLGVGGEALHEWLLPTRSFAEMQGSDEEKAVCQEPNMYRSRSRREMLEELPAEVRAKDGKGRRQRWAGCSRTPWRRQTGRG